MGKPVELLAPAGNYEAFLGALNAGADAIYLGGEKFSARAYADNFDTDGIVRALHVAHFYGKKIYLTVNTLLKERETATLQEYLLPFYEAGLDGVIVQDFGVFRYIRERFPGLPLHVSTQMTVTGARGAALLKEQGACRIVPARELSLREVERIREEAGVEVECFIHGAMCYSYSGQCLFSSILGGRSGNRGRCAQPCRLPYGIYEGKAPLSGSGYPLSLKDMCTLAYLPALMEAGIDSFKIEGRMKRPEYAAGVTAVYRKYIDLYYRKGAAAYRVEPEDMDRLRRLYIRSELQTGYYERHNGKEMITLEKPGYSGCDEALLSEIQETYLREPEKMPVRMQAVVKVGEPLRLQIGTSVLTGETVLGEEVQPAKNAPLSEEDIRKRLCKTGDSLLTVTACEIAMEGEGFVPVRALNGLRRRAVESFEETVIKSRCADGAHSCSEEGKTEEPEETTERMQFGRTQQRAVDCLVTTLEQLRAVTGWGGCRRIYLESDLFLESYEEIAQLTEAARQAQEPWKFPFYVLALPYVLRERDAVWLQSLTDRLKKKQPLVQGFLVRSLEGLAWARELKTMQESIPQGYSIVADAGLYCFNPESARFLSAFAEEITIPYELHAGETAGLAASVKERGMGVNLIAYSRIPMMVTANCLQKTAGLCSGGKGQKRHLFLKDRKGATFPVGINCRHCYNVIYNSVPYSLHNAREEREKIGADAFRYDFVTEDGDQCRRILEGNFPFPEYTTGHSKRGVK